MSNPHNHPPRCCCPLAQDPTDLGQWGPARETCPVCPEHGELASRVELVDTGSMFAAVTIKPTDLEHTPDLYSQIRADQIRADRQQPACSRPGSNRGDGRGCTDPACPRHGEPREDEDNDGPAPYFCGYCPHAAPCAWGDCTGPDRDIAGRAGR